MDCEADGTGQADDQVRQLLDCFEPLARQLGVLTADDASSLSISLVRYFDIVKASAETLRRDGGNRFDGLSLEGFHLDVVLLQRMIDLGCPLDKDEYDEYDEFDKEL